MDELIPIYRIEFFLDAIVNNTTPPDPIYRAEFYLAKIAGADVEIPEPVYRTEKYLAYLCGEGVELPDPIYRIEYYLAFLCGLNVELPEPIYRVEFWLWDWCGGGGIEKTVTGNPIHITDALAKPAQALSVKLEPVQAGSGDPSPDNVRPISGHTDADVIVSPTLNQSDGTTYPIPLGQTVYGGTLDVLTGVLTVDRAEVTLPLGNPYIIGTYSDRKDCGWNFPQKAPGLTNVWSQAFKTESANAVPPIYCVAGRGANTYVTFGVPLAEADDAQSAGDYIRSLSPSIVIELATPITIQLTPQQVELLLGENNVWSDGTMTLVYLADGNASDEEALNILLGGRYVNNHEADEPTDREALDILLGGTR